MPELIEAECYRVAAAELVGRTVSDVVVADPGYLRGAASALLGQRIVAAERVGKVVVLRLDSGATVGLRFGMTGRLAVNGVAAVARLEYGPATSELNWPQFTLSCDDGTTLVIDDPRRLGSVTVDIDLSALGPDAASLTVTELRSALGRSRSPLKARLLDQSAIAGLGNLLADETLWRASLDPLRPAISITSAESARLALTVRQTVALLSRRGGSHLGDLQQQRRRGGICPRCGRGLLRRSMAGRTTYSCPDEQR